MKVMKEVSFVEVEFAGKSADVVNYLTDHELQIIEDHPAA